jgi:D-3-phosphoglycerate dehydrogenase / 2-oxoglutarate reductase
VVTTVITATAFADAAIERDVLERAGVDVSVTDARTPDEIVEVAAQATAILVQFARIDASVFARLPVLRFISRYGVGVDNIDLAAADKHGVLVSNVPRYGRDEVALHATSMILGLVRHLPAYDRAVRAGRWDHRATGDVASPSDLTLGLYGLGRIGRQVAARAGPWFGAVIAHDPLVTPDRDVAHGPLGAQGSPVVDMVGVDDLFRRADVVSLHAPLNDDTAGVVDGQRLRLLGPSGYLVNTARGGLVHIDDLVAVLEAGELAGAALDVQPEEPPPPDHPILRRPEVLLTPHVAWYSDASEAELRREAANNIIAWLDGAPRNIVGTRALERP